MPPGPASNGDETISTLETRALDERQALLHTVLLPSLFLLVAMLNLTLLVAGLKELVVDELGGNEQSASWFFAIEMTAYIVFAPIWGVLSDGLGRRRPFIVLGFLASAALYASYLTVTDIGTLLGLRFVQGAFTVMGWSTLMATVLDQPNEAKRGRYMGIMGGSLSLGVALGAPIGGFVSSAFGAWAPIRLAAALFLLLALGSLTLRDRGRTKRRTSFNEIAHTLRRRPRLLLPALFYFVDRYTVGFFVVLFPLYLSSLGVDDPAVRGRYLALFLLPFALLQYWSGRLTERIGPYTPLLGGSLLYGALLCVVGFSDLHTLWWVMGGLGILASVMFPPAIFLTARFSDSNTRGSAMGAFNLAGSLGFAVGPIVGVWAYETRGYGFAFVIAGALEMLAVAIALLWLKITAPSRQPSEEAAA